MWTWWWRQYGSFMNDLASSEPTCEHDDDVSTDVFWMTSPPLNETCVHEDGVRTEFLRMTLTPLNRHVKWWWHQHGSFNNDLASSGPTYEHDDGVSTGVLWMTLPPLNLPVNMMMTSVWDFYEWHRLLLTDQWTWWRNYWSFINDLDSSEPTCVCDDDVSTGVLWMTSPSLNRPVYMIMTSVRKIYEWPLLLWTDLCLWWWRQYGSFMNDLGSSVPTCVHDDDVSTGVLWRTSPPLNLPVNMMMT